MTKGRYIIIFSLLFAFCYIGFSCAGKKSYVITNTITQQEQSALSPWQALQKLKDGNERFVTGSMLQRDFISQLAHSKSQYPFAVILSCIDSRSSPEIIFDQGIGDIFGERLAGNVVDGDVLGGMEYATKISGAKLIVVLGHSSCGAIKGACNGIELGNLTALLEKIKPSVSQFQKAHSQAICDSASALDEIAKQNVLNSMKEIKQKSPIITSLIREGKIGLVGGMLNLTTGRVIFFESEGL